MKAYAIAPDAIHVRFADKVYTYTYVEPGRTHVEHMKALAHSGRGLSTYISRHVKGQYADQT